MSLIPKDTIKILGEIAGISNLKDDIASALASDSEYRLREIIQEAIKFMKHSKRQKLTADDVNHALRIRNVEPLYGFKSKDPFVFKKVPGVGTDLYYIQDEELDCSEVINAPLPKLPLEPSFGVHWLAIEGVQPAIPQNPTQNKEAEREREKERDREREREKEKQRANTTVEVPTSATEGEENVQVKQLVKHVLSKELQAYYEKIVESVLKKEPEIRKAALNSLKSDAGIHQLVPYFCRFVGEKVGKNLRNLDVLWTAMRVADSLLNNPNLFIEPYLDVLMPAIMTCLVSHNLCSNQKKDDHWSLREFAAQLISLICSRYGEAYATLQPRIAKTVLRAFLDPLKPMPSHYGAVLGLGALGRESVRVLLIPNVKPYGQLLQTQLNETNKNELKRMEAQKVKQALVRVLGETLKQESKFLAIEATHKRKHDEEKPIPLFDSFPKTLQELQEIFGFLADDLLPFIQSETKSVQ